MTSVLTVGSLFSGIGGFDLGLERAGMRVRWQVEINSYCQRVLAKHWPHVQRYGDIQSVDWGTVEPVDVLCGGFPCQDISLAGKGAGLAGERSGLWFEYAKAIEALTPRYVIIENVAALRSRGLDQVLGALAALGYDAEWHCIPASAVGAPHRRDRVWIMAYAGREGQPCRRIREWEAETCEVGNSRPPDSSETVADTDSERLAQRGRLHDTERTCAAIDRCDWWAVEPELGRVAHGIPHRVDRLRGLGNAIVPQIAEMIGAWILLREEVSV